MTEERRRGPPGAESLRRAAEDLVTRREAGSRPRPVESPDRLQHEMNVQQIELEMQNEELQKTCEELRQAHDRYLKLYEFAPVGYVTTDSEGFIRSANLKFAAMVKTDRTRLGATRLAQLVLKEDRPLLYRLLENVHEPGASAQLRLMATDGAAPWVLMSAEPALDDMGVVGECFLTVSDISAQKRVEAVLAEKEERLRLAVDAAEVGIFDWDIAAASLRWSPRHEAIFGYASFAPDVTATRPLRDWTDRIHPEDLPLVLGHLPESVGRKRTFQAEYRVVRRDGEVRWVAGRGEVTHDGSGQPVRMVGTTVDITAQKTMEEDLRKSHDELERRVKERTAELDRRVGQLRILAGELSLTEQRERRRIAKLLHDHLQQLLVSAKFRVELLSRVSDEIVRRAADEVEGILNECINSSRSLTTELSPPILHEGGLAASLEWLSRWMADKHGLKAELSVERGLPPVVEDLKTLLFESVRELLFNAVKHARVHSAVVNVRQIQGGTLKITVSDEGGGFDPAALRPPGQEGRGFGLFSIRERLDLIGGRLEIDSSPGCGTRIVLMAPFSAPRAPGEADPGAGPRAGR